MCGTVIYSYHRCTCLRHSPATSSPCQYSCIVRTDYHWGCDKVRCQGIPRCLDSRRSLMPKSMASLCWVLHCHWGSLSASVTSSLAQRGNHLTARLSDCVRSKGKHSCSPQAREHQRRHAGLQSMPLAREKSVSKMESPRLNSSDWQRSRNRRNGRGGEAERSGGTWTRKARNVNDPETTGARSRSRGAGKVDEGGLYGNDPPVGASSKRSTCPIRSLCWLETGTRRPLGCRRRRTRSECAEEEVQPVTTLAGPACGASCRIGTQWVRVGPHKAWPDPGVA
jgi:hypothetical protein